MCSADIFFHMSTSDTTSGAEYLDHRTRIIRSLIRYMTKVPIGKCCQKRKMRTKTMFSTWVSQTTHHGIFMQDNFYLDVLCFIMPMNQNCFHFCIYLSVYTVQINLIYYSFCLGFLKFFLQYILIIFFSFPQLLHDPTYPGSCSFSLCLCLCIPLSVSLCLSVSFPHTYTNKNQAKANKMKNTY